jgi:tRNA A37 threonylcarbamoyladenosine modification protein TsaB
LIEAKLPEYYYSVYENGMITEMGADIIENLEKKLKNDTVLVGDFDDETQIKHCYFNYINLKNCKSELDALVNISAEKYNSGNTAEASAVQPLYLKDFNFRKP